MFYCFFHSFGCCCIGYKMLGLRIFEYAREVLFNMLINELEQPFIFSYCLMGGLDRF